MESNNSIVTGFDNDKDDSLKITLKTIPNVQGGIVCVLEGYIDTYNSSFFQKQLTKVIGAGYFNILFNCSSLSYVSSTGLGSFTILLKMVKAKGGDIVLAEVQEKVSEVFQILGFSQFFNLKNTMDEAMDFLCNRGKTPQQSVFPKIVACPSCAKSVQATRAGRFRCSNCKAIISISEEGEISLN
ncbi:MAG: STAS domain-containing protein [Treponema sp.]|nr:STAS domain-containing protein [Treponema sp.]